MLLQCLSWGCLLWYLLTLLWTWCVPDVLDVYFPAYTGCLIRSVPSHWALLTLQANRSMFLLLSVSPLELLPAQVQVLRQGFVLCTAELWGRLSQLTVVTVFWRSYILLAGRGRGLKNASNALQEVLGTFPQSDYTSHLKLQEFPLTRLLFLLKDINNGLDNQLKKGVITWICVVSACFHICR